MWGVYSKAIDWNIALLRFHFGWVYLKKEHFQSLKTYKMTPIYFSVFGIQLQIWSPKIKYECAAQYFSPLRLDKHPTCLCLKLKNFEKKSGDKIVVIFEQIMQFCCPSIFRILKTLLNHSVSWKYTKKKLLSFGRNWRLILGNTALLKLAEHPQPHPLFWAVTEQFYT